MASRSTNKGETLIMLGKLHEDDAGFDFEILRDGTAIAQGKARVSDETHISYEIYDRNGQSMGQGRFHLNHHPK